MTKLPGCVAAAAIGAVIVTATPSFGAGVNGGRHFVGGFHNRACFRHHRHFRSFAVVGGAFFFDYVPYYYGYVPYYGTYCWQQVWTPSGWQWVDVCPGYHGYAY
jgi:hypothetical protein